MQFLVGFILGGLVIGYWRDLKFRNEVNKTIKYLFKKTKAEKKQVDNKDKPKDSEHPSI
jgi:hypothetical protein